MAASNAKLDGLVKRVNAVQARFLTLCAPPMTVNAVAAACAILLSAVPARAHHEALFGPQSASVLSPDSFLGAQVFSRRSGGPGERTQETTTVLSSGFSPTQDGRLSIAAVVPFSFIIHQGSRGSQRGLEDAIISARYRVDLEGLKQKLGAFESYVVGIGGVELPTGTMDHEFMQGSAGLIGAGLMSVEIRPFSVVGYVYLHREGTVERLRGGGSRFVGASAAWTPIDDMDTGRVLSFQLGVSHETSTPERLAGAPVADTGGHAVLVHPTVTFGLNKQLLLFALTSIPVSQSWRDPADEQRFRVALGTILTF